MTTGHSMVELPHARLSGGARTLLVLEGLTLENKAPTGRALRLLPATMPGGRRGSSMARSTSSASQLVGRLPSTSPPTTASWSAGWC
jgi:hypothetical protein